MRTKKQEQIIEGMKKRRCNGKLTVVGREKGYSHLQTVFGKADGRVTRTSYKCEHGHEYETTGIDMSCSNYKKLKQERKMR